MVSLCWYLEIVIRPCLRKGNSMFDLDIDRYLLCYSTPVDGSLGYHFSDKCSIIINFHLQGAFIWSLCAGYCFVYFVSVVNRKTLCLYDQSTRGISGCSFGHINTIPFLCGMVGNGRSYLWKLWHWVSSVLARYGWHFWVSFQPQKHQYIALRQASWLKPVSSVRSDICRQMSPLDGVKATLSWHCVALQSCWATEDGVPDKMWRLTFSPTLPERPRGKVAT